jgi:hypothetical protein
LNFTRKELYFLVSCHTTSLGIFITT